MHRSLVAAIGLFAVADASCPEHTDPYRTEPSPFGWPLTPGAWDFDHQDCWSSKYPMCDGEMQSPMDINLKASSAECLVEDMGAAGSLTASYKAVGHSPTVTVSTYMRSVAVSGEFGSITLKDVHGHDVEYQAEQVHLTAGSLHSVNGTAADAELLVIHRPTAPSTRTPRSVVVSMLLHEGAAESAIFSQMGLAASGEASSRSYWEARSVIDLNNALKDGLAGNFYSYSGSVPVPPCTESVHYIVLAEQQSVVAAQLDKLKSVLSTHAGGFQKRRPVTRTPSGKECRHVLVNRAELSQPTTTCTQASANVAACWSEWCDKSPVHVQPELATAEESAQAPVLAYKAAGNVSVQPSTFTLDASGDFGHLMVNGRLFQAKKVSFRALSQHIFDGQRYAGEVVIEHHLFGDDFAESQEHHRRLGGQEAAGPHAVMVTVPLKLGRESPLLRAFGLGAASHKRAIRNGQKYDISEPVDLTTLLQPSMSKSWYWYSGGPTTPGTCPAWGVKWLVFEEPLEMHLSQLNFLDLPVSGFDSVLPAQPATVGLLSKGFVPDDGVEAAGSCEITSPHYLKPSCWKVTNPICSAGKAQSPINIDTSVLSQVGSVRFLPKLSWKPIIGLRLSNTGEALGFDSKQLGYTTIIGADEFPKYYQVVTAELRMPSEHMIDGKQYAAELQIMHKKQNTVLDLDDNDVLFTSVFFELGEASKLLGQMLPEELPHASEHKTIEKPVDLQWALGPALDGPFYKYDGSHTSPSCTEVAQWVVFEKPMTLSEQQLRHFKTLFPNPGNNRPLQALNSRPVLKNTLQEPEQASYRFFLNREMGRDRTAKTPPGMIIWPILGTLTLCFTIMAGTFQREDKDLKSTSAGGLGDDEELVTMVGRRAI